MKKARKKSFYAQRIFFEIGLSVFGVSFGRSSLFHSRVSLNFA